MKILANIIKWTLLAFVLLFVVYFWNLDQKLVAWVYRGVHKVFDRKKVDIVF